MKIFSIIAIIGTLVFANTFSADAAVVNHQANLLTYSKRVQPIIKIATGNAKGMNYEVQNEKKEQVIKGVIKNTEDILIPSYKLEAGKYIFKVNGKSVKTFIIE